MKIPKFIELIRQEVHYKIGTYEIHDPEEGEDCLVVRVFNVPENEEKEIWRRIHRLGDEGLDRDENMSLAVIFHNQKETEESFPEQSQSHETT